MALPISIPYTFANATTSIPLSQLDTDISTIYATVNGIGNGTVALSNVVITGGIISNVSGISTSAISNRIINGNMLIDQRNAGASVTPTSSAYTVDRWQYQCSVASKMSVQQNAGSVTPPATFSNYLGFTTTSAYTPAAGDFFEFVQKIEGFNFSDMDWGTANAKTVTLSFWVRSSLTGTHGGSFTNSVGTRSYPFTFSISSANTWEYKTVTVAGDTTGTWVGATNGQGVVVYFDLGSGSTFRGTAGSWSSANYVGATGAVSVVGTSGATFYITGVQLEVGTVATPYEMQIYSDQLAQCQRYYFKTFNQGVAPAQGVGINKGEWCTARVVAGANPQRNSLILPVVMRTTPTTTYYNPVNANAQAYNGDQAADCSATQNLSSAQGDSKVTMYTINTAAGSAGEALIVHITASAEL